MSQGRQPGAISLQKVTLTAASPQVSLTKSGGGTGTIRINLNWSQGGAAAAPSGQKAGGFFKRMAAQVAAARGVDLDLGCLYELSDGSKGVVQALGNSFGSLDQPPWIKLDGDDRTGSVTGGENMSINLEQPGRFKRVLIFAMIYEGAPNWAAVDGVVTLSPINGPQIEVRLDASDQAARICAVAQLINHGNDLVVQREVQYINGGQSVLDKAFNWGMNWTPGRK
ncbi:tellurium resistance protein [Nakamurella sp. UYEF19]|uniref:TerD family protein n=1 Tax=Nakamurella sp. UYEF19 TaxID=1756392 RepID=UPI0033944B87